MAHDSSTCALPGKNDSSLVCTATLFKEVLGAGYSVFKRWPEPETRRQSGIRGSSTQMDFVSKCKDVLRIIWERNPKVLLFGVIAFACLAASQPLFAHPSSQTLSSATQSQEVDPNKGPSELNHHIAGWALIGVGLVPLTSLLFPSRRTHRYIWPALLVLAGLFLALWSDGEIWPRGNLNWSWLFQHDAEARQHKIYSVLLAAIGIVEYVRILGLLPRFWKTWAFSVLAMVGAGMLLIHDHASGSGAHLPEAQAYLVNPALEVDGSVRRMNAITIAKATTDDQQQRMHHFSEHALDAPALESGNMPMNHSQLAMDAPPRSTVHIDHHYHLMTASMLRVEREHIWFMIVGLAIALFKFLSDGEFFNSRIVRSMWPSCMVLLGFMLVFYRE